MSNFSLMGSLRTCKVDTSWADKIQSDRFQNPSEMVCPLWNGVDTAGREVFQDSFYTKNAGCNSAEDRIGVENAVSRPQYMEYINLNAAGLDGDIYGNTEARQNTILRQQGVRDAQNYGGQFGLVSDWGNINPSCIGSGGSKGNSSSYTAYSNAMDNMNYLPEEQRLNQMRGQYNSSENFRYNSGF